MVNRIIEQITMMRKIGPATPENQLTVIISYSPTKVVFNRLLKWTPSVNTQEVFIHEIQLQQCGCCPLVRLLVSTPQAEPYEMTVDSETTLQQPVQYPV